MKKVSIKQMHFVNFKGFADYTIRFNEGVSEVHGRNGSGKTTIFDGFTWLLFGKDSQDRKAFDIKTLDANGIAIPRLPHEVSATITVDGEEVSLCRRFKEKWVKRRGATEDEFIGNEEERIYNDVPCSMREWNEKISAICSEQVFKYVTNPAYFVSLKADVQRAMLFRMAGEVKDADIAEGNADFTELLAHLTGKTMEEYKREIQAKKRRVKTEIDAIPERIDERKRDIAAIGELDFAALEKELEVKQGELAHVEEELLDASKRGEAEAERRKAQVEHIGKLKEQLLRVEFGIKESVSENYRKAVSKRNELLSDIAAKENEVRRCATNLREHKEYVALCDGKRTQLIAEWKSINAERLTFNENDFVCPTCKRPFDVAEVEAKQAEMTANFNERKAARLAENVKNGQANTKKMQELQACTDELTAKMDAAQKEVDALKAQPLYTQKPVAPDSQPAIEASSEWQKVREEIEEAERAYQTSIVSPDTAGQEVQERKRAIIAETDRIKGELSKRDAIRRHNERIMELEHQLRNGSQALAELERIEFIIAAFNKARIEAVDKRINGMFKLVKFKMYEQQINGGEVETCEATVNGVPYSSLNNAMRINAGLDIINAICKFEDISAPVIIDNCESIISPLATESQQIRLYVADEDLNIK